MPDVELPEGRGVQVIALRNGPMRANVLTLGGIVRDLRPDKVAHPLVPGCANVVDYLQRGSMSAPWWALRQSHRARPRDGGWQALLGSRPIDFICLA